MFKARNGKTTRKIEASKVKEYLEKGYSVADENGNIVFSAPEEKADNKNEGADATDEIAADPEAVEKNKPGRRKKS